MPPTSVRPLPRSSSIQPSSRQETRAWSRETIGSETMTALSGLRPMRTVWPGSNVNVWPANVILSSRTVFSRSRLPASLRAGSDYRYRWDGRSHSVKGWLAARPVHTVSAGRRVGDRLVHLRLPRGEFGLVLLLVDALGDVLVGLHQRLEVALGGGDHAQVGERVPDLRAPQPDVPDARHDPGEQQGPERLLHRRLVSEIHALVDIEAEPLPDLLGAEPAVHQVTALDEEVLALGALGLGQLGVVVAQREPAERHVPGLVLHDIGEQLGDEGVVRHVPVHAERREC